MRRTGDIIPDFKFNTLDGEGWHSRGRISGYFALLTIYRGKWCPYCKAQLQALDALHASFLDVGVSPVAVSADTRARAETSQRDYGLENLQLGYEMPIEPARQLGVFISAGINDREMPLFCEPASFLIAPGNRIQAAWIASNAFARTRMDEVRAYIDFLNDHPDRAPRGGD
ncbi:redoxin domain-containing protein [Nioella aestuarii]|uniref:redoxin domain-containing protein n=1 Tax=Nioella aestuarii TaxID=1662864 RepID=UPI003D7F4F9E